MPRRASHFVGIGIDLVELDRAKRFLRKHRHNLSHFFLKHEHNLIRKSKHKSEAFAVLFAAKEATSKAIGMSIAHPRQLQHFSINFKRCLAVRLKGLPAQVIKLKVFRTQTAMGVVALAS